MRRFGTTFRSYSKADRDSVVKLLADLDSKYPNGLEWLNGRLADIEAGRAVADVLTIGQNLTAVAITTPKGKGHAKLSTFMVHPAFRRRGIGECMIRGLARRWTRSDISEIFVTVDRDDSATLSFFEKQHFLPRREFIRYGVGRWDQIMRWTPDGTASSSSFVKAKICSGYLSRPQENRVSPSLPQVSVAY